MNKGHKNGTKTLKKKFKITEQAELPLRRKPVWAGHQNCRFDSMAHGMLQSVPKDGMFCLCFSSLSRRYTIHNKEKK